jgi:hypothetical protein
MAALPKKLPFLPCIITWAPCMSLCHAGKDMIQIPLPSSSHGLLPLPRVGRFVHSIVPIPKSDTSLIFLPSSSVWRDAHASVKRSALVVKHASVKRSERFQRNYMIKFLFVLL